MAANSDYLTEVNASINNDAENGEDISIITPDPSNMYLNNEAVSPILGPSNQMNEQSPVSISFACCCTNSYFSSIFSASS